MKLNPKDNQEAYKNQAPFAPPPDGTYHMVGKGIRHDIVGKNKTPRLTIPCHILKCVDGGGQEFVGKVFQFQLWWNLEKDGNVSRAGVVALAMGCDDVFDPTDDDDLVKVYTGHAFQVKLETRTSEWEGQTRKNTEVVEVKRLSDEVRKKYAAMPDWQKIIGDKKSRVLEPRDTSNGKKTGYQQKKSSDPFGDDNIPF